MCEDDAPGPVGVGRESRASHNREPSGRLDELGLVGAADWMCRTMMANGQTIAAARLRRRPVARARPGRMAMFVAVTAMIAIAVLGCPLVAVVLTSEVRSVQ